jgi:putative DNA primase/helicase
MPDPNDTETRIDNVVNLLDLKGGTSKGVHKVLERLQGKPPYANEANALVILDNDPAFAGMLGFSDFILVPLILRPPPVAEDGALPLPGPYPRPWGEADLSLIVSYIQRVWCPKMKKADVKGAMWASASQRRFHPIRDWLAALKWDGTPRIDTWLNAAFETPDDDYHTVVGAKFLIAAVRRIRHPGCKFDQLVILEGSQGIGKSRACRALFSPEWFSDNLHPDLSSRDAPISLAGVWGVELSEIQHFIRNDRNVIKAFLSRQVDRYRPVNGKFVIDVPRQSVLIGSTNQSFYLDDDTGNRRIWPVACAECRVEWIEKNRTQLWAEAAMREAAREAIFIDDNDTSRTIEQAQSQRMVEDMWADPIADYLVGRTVIRLSSVLADGLGLSRSQQSRANEMRVAGIMRSLGWNVTVAKEGKKSLRIWKPNEESHLL